MTDKDALFAYRLKQAEETLTDAERMLQGNFSPRSIINRAYYSMKNVPLVSKEEMEDIENLYGKPSPNKEVAFSETIEV